MTSAAKRDRDGAGPGSAVTLHLFVSPVILIVLTLAFFSPLLFHPSRVLYSEYSDFLALHLPSRWFLVQSFQETGELPLWCPSSFAGMPFIHDIQVSAFYPLHLPLLLLPVQYLGAAQSWLVVFHVAAAGLGMYAYGRSQGLGRLGALVAGIGFMFAGKWLTHVLAAGHYNMIPLAWLPLVLLGLEGAIRRGSAWRAAAAGAAFSLLILAAYPYLTFYAGLFVALWTVIPALEYAGWFGSGRKGSLGAALARWLGYGALAAGTGTALAAVQLLPALEAAGEATRLELAPTLTWRAALRSLVGVVGPPPAVLGPAGYWEERGLFGLLWLVTAAWACLLGDKRRRAQAMLCLLFLLFGMGGAALFQELPGFRLFRLPSRMFLVVGLPLALLAASATEALFSPAGVGRRRARWCQLLLLAMSAAAAILTLVAIDQLRRAGAAPRLPAYWLVPAAGIPVALLLLGHEGFRARPAARLAWPVLLAADLWALSMPWVEVRRLDEVFPPSLSVAVLVGCRADLGRVLDRDPPLLSDTPLGCGAPQAMFHGLQPLRGFNPIDVRRYKEYIQFVEDTDTPLIPLQSPLTFPVIPDPQVRNRPLLDLLGARYLLQPRDMPVPGSGWRVLSVDSGARAFDFVDGGVWRLPPFAVYENEDVFPRAFTVTAAAPLPGPDRVLGALKATDFRTCVLLKDYQGPEILGTGGVMRPAAVRTYQPNRVVVETDGEEAAYLVLTDIWYPGWEAAVDGQPAPIYQANYAFRAVAVPAGRHEVAFRFSPRSYWWGKLFTAATVLVLIALTAWTSLARRLLPAACNRAVPAGPPHT